MGAPTIILFDIDGTLVSSGGASRAALISVFLDWYGRADVFDGLPFGGRTDRAIMRHGLRQAGVEPTEAAIDAVIDAYVSRLDHHLAAAGPFALHPGVTDLLDQLETLPTVASGLGTGNVEAGARRKLAPFGLNPRLPFGGFGCDAEDRAELLRIGFARGAARLGCAVAACRRVIVGDTPRDVEGARANDAEAIAVSTGQASAEALRSAAPDLVVDTLADPAVWATLRSGGFRPPPRSVRAAR